MEHYLNYLSEGQLQGITGEIKDGKIELSLKLAYLNECQVVRTQLEEELKERSKKMKALRAEESILYRHIFEGQNQNIDIKKEIESIQLESEVYSSQKTKLMRQYDRSLQRKQKMKDQIISLLEKDKILKEKDVKIHDKILQLKNACLKQSENIILAQKKQIASLEMIKSLEQIYKEQCYNQQNLQLQSTKISAQLKSIVNINNQIQSHINQQQQQQNNLNQRTRHNKKQIIMQFQAFQSQKLRNNELKDQLKRKECEMKQLKQKNEKNYRLASQLRSKLSRIIQKQEKKNMKWTKQKHMMKIKLEYAERFLKRQQNNRLGYLLKLH